ncbi:hypothetical protein RugamoR64_24070 [Duganella rhizosphaerae]
MGAAGPDLEARGGRLQIADRLALARGVGQLGYAVEKGLAQRGLADRGGAVPGEVLIAVEPAEALFDNRCGAADELVGPGIVLLQQGEAKRTFDEAEGQRARARADGGR